MQCPNCKTENDYRSVQCIRCGYAFVPMQPQVPPMSQVGTPGQQVPPMMPQSSPPEWQAPQPGPHGPSMMPQVPSSEWQAPQPPQWQAPQTMWQQAPPPASPGYYANDTFGGMIPVHNPNALAAYYLGIFSFIPCIGIFLGIPAFFLGRKALKFAKANPQVRGKTHAWVGILAGGIFGFGQVILTLGLLVYYMISSR